MTDILESFEIQDIKEPILNIEIIKKILRNRMNEQGYSENDINSFLGKIKKGFGYQKSFDGFDYLIFYAFEDSWLEYHFVKLDDLSSVGQDTKNLKSSQDLFSFLLSIAFKQLKKCSSVRIIAPEDNTKRQELYLKIIQKVLKQYNLGHKLFRKDNIFELECEGKKPLWKSKSILEMYMEK